MSPADWATAAVTSHGSPSFLTDEHVPRVFVTVLRSNSHTVIEVRDVFGEATNDEELLAYCSQESHPPTELAGEVVWLSEWRR